MRGHLAPHHALQQARARRPLRAEGSSEHRFGDQILSDPEELGTGHLTDLFAQEKLGQSVKQIQAGLSLRAGLTAELELGFDDAAAATKLTAELDKFLKMVSNRKTGGPELADLGKNLKITAQAIGDFHTEVRDLVELLANGAQPDE